MVAKPTRFCAGHRGSGALKHLTTNGLSKGGSWNPILIPQT